MKSIKVNEETHANLRAIAAYLTLKFKKSKGLGDAVEHLVNAYLSRHKLEAEK